MKTVTIFRKEELNSHIPPEVRKDAIVKLGSVLKDRAPLRGLNKKDEKNILADYLGLDPSEKDFYPKVKQYWAELTLKVPYDGIKLNIELEDDGTPVEVSDYVTYKWALVHPYVAHSKTELETDSRKKFYIHDEREAERAQSVKVSQKKDAYKEFIKVSKDEDKMDRVLRMFEHTKPERLSREQKENALDAIINREPVKFHRVATDKNLDVKAEIYTMLEHNILRKVGNQVYYIDEQIGNDMDEAVLYFNNDRNSETVTTLRAKLKEFA